MLKKAVESALANMLHYGEIDYNLSLIKNTELDRDDLTSIYDKSMQTLNVLMIKLGMETSFNKVRDKYNY